MAKSKSGGSVGKVGGGAGAPSHTVKNFRPKRQLDVVDWVKQDTNAVAAKMLSLGHPKGKYAPNGIATQPGRSTAR